jgi:hypothetical protein
MNKDSNIFDKLILESSDKLRELLGLTAHEVIPKPFPKIVSRKDLSLDNYFADLILRACYKKIDVLPEFEEIVIRGSDEELPTKLNPQIKGAVLIGIGGRSKNKDFISSYDEHSEQGARSADSASQIVFFRHLNKHKKTHPGVRSILPILNEINLVDSKGGAGENHLNQIAKDLHLYKFYKPGFIVEELPSQWKRAIIESILVSVCIKNKELKKIDSNESTKELREIFKKYIIHRQKAVDNGVFMPLSDKENISNIIFDKVRGRIASNVREADSFFTLRRIFFALKSVWGENIAYIIIAFVFEAKLQLTAEFVRTSRISLDETYIAESKSYLIYYIMSQDDMKPHRGIGHKLNEEQKNGIVVLKDPRRYTTAIFKSKLLDGYKWERFVNWLQHEEPGLWYIPFDKEKGLAEFILNGTRYYLGSEPSSLSKDDLIIGIKKSCI